jgi:hypothetical protein
MSKAEAFEVNFGENKSIGVNVNFSKGDAIQVPVNINSLDTDVIAKKIADQLQLPEIDTTELAKESTLNAVSSKLDNLNVEVDLSNVAKQGENQEATNSKILEEIGNVATALTAINDTLGTL